MSISNIAEYCKNIFQESTDTVHNSKYILIQYYFPYSRNSYTRDTGHNTFGSTPEDVQRFYPDDTGSAVFHFMGYMQLKGFIVFYVLILQVLR